MDADRAEKDRVTIRAPIEGLAEGERVLPREASRYLCRVLRLAEGDRFIAFDPSARVEADVTVVVASADAARVHVDAVRAPAVVAEAELVLVYAFSKGDKVDAVVRDATELGATAIVVAQTERSIAKAKSDAERASSKLDRWRRIAIEAARQCGRADPPRIEGIVPWSDALERASACEGRFCLDPRAAAPLGGALDEVVAPERRASLAFAIGPEGGLTSDEIEIAIGKGWLPASLGPFVLRTETVAAAVLGALRVLAGRAAVDRSVQKGGATQ
jgi:16S rRNA (uracil1498-N3)-methyltransferase